MITCRVLFGCQHTLIADEYNFTVLKKKKKKLNKLRRNFLWKGNKEGGGYNLVKWEEIQLSEIRED